MDSPRTVTLRLEDSSSNQGRAVRTQAWSLRVGDTWLPLRDWAGSQALLARHGISIDEDEFEERPPGCRFLRAYVLTVPIGTAVLCHASVPRPARARGPMAPLGGQPAAGDVARWVVANFPPAQTPLVARDTEYRVTRSGRLVTEAFWQEGRARAASRKPLPRARRIEGAAPAADGRAATVVSKAG